MRLQGKSVVVTGANSGNVVIDYVTDDDKTQELIRAAKEAGGRAVGIRADVANPAEVQAIIERAVDTFGRLDIMINNAGIGSQTSLLDTSEADFDRVMAVNVKGTFFGAQLAAKQFIAQGGGGLILNISSNHEDWPMPGNTTYCVSKGGIRMLTRTAGLELAAHGIRMINLAPGAVRTPINADTTADPAKLSALNAAIPLGRMADASEIGALAVMLASDAASYMTATTVFADAGLMHASLGL
jgi:glucose 1-dehydrogenase